MRVPLLEKVRIIIAFHLNMHGGVMLALMLMVVVAEEVPMLILMRMLMRMLMLTLTCKTTMPYISEAQVIWKAKKCTHTCERTLCGLGRTFGTMVCTPSTSSRYSSSLSTVFTTHTA